MGLVNEYINVRITSFNMHHYKELGYEIPLKINKKGNYVLDQKAYIRIKAQDLTCGSHVKVKCKCDNCGKISIRKYKDYYNHNYNGKTYCANCVYSVLHSGINNPNYRSDKTFEERIADRSSPEYQIFVKKVMARDNYACQCCGNNKSGTLEVHHLYAYNKYEELRFDETNGITLCKNCHKNFHNKYGNGNNTKEQFLEWMNISEYKLEEYNGVLPSRNPIYNYDKQIIYSNGVIDAANDLDSAIASIYSCCYANSDGLKNKNIKCRTIKNSHLFWLSDYEYYGHDEIMKYVNYYPKSVICLTTGKIFNKIKDAHNYYGANQNCIIACCKHIRNCTHSGKLPNGTKLEWMYYNDYLKQKAS
jgi:5-methylcytosine-specific restriction endonuclease McrA